MLIKGSKRNIKDNQGKIPLEMVESNVSSN